MSLLDRFRRLVLVFAGFTVPIEYVSLFDLGGFVVTPPKVAIGLLVALAALQWTADRRAGARSKKSPWIILFGASAVTSLVASSLQGLPVRNLVVLSTSYVSIIAFYFLLLVSLRSRRDLELFLVSLVLGTVFVTATALLGFGLQRTTVYGSRMGGLGGNANQLAFNGIFALALAFYLVFSARSLAAKTLWIGAVIVLFAGVAGTLSRSAILGLGAMWALWAFRFGRFDTLRYVFPAFVVMVAAVIFAPESLRERLTTLSPTEIEADESAQQRLQAAPIALRAFASNPLTGIGLLNFNVWAERNGYEIHNVIHNMFLQVLAEQGLLGFIPLIVVVFLTWSELSKPLRARTRYRGDGEFQRLVLCAAFVQIGFLGLFVMSQFQPTQKHKALWLAFAVAPVVLKLARLRASTAPVVESSEPDPAPASLRPHPDFR